MDFCPDLIAFVMCVARQNQLKMKPKVRIRRTTGSEIENRIAAINQPSAYPAPQIDQTNMPIINSNK